MIDKVWGSIPLLGTFLYKSISNVCTANYRLICYAGGWLGWQVRGGSKEGKG